MTAGLHEDPAALATATVSRHRAIASLREELDAVDWYDQRCDAEVDEELRAILAHNRDEEKEHACMLLEWLRRRDPSLDHYLRRYLFTAGPIAEAEREDGGGRDGALHDARDADLGIGSLR